MSADVRSLPVNAPCPHAECGRLVWRDEAQPLGERAFASRCMDGHRVRIWIRPDGAADGWERDLSEAA